MIVGLQFLFEFVVPVQGESDISFFFFLNLFTFEHFCLLAVEADAQSRWLAIDLLTSARKTTFCAKISASINRRIGGHPRSCCKRHFAFSLDTAFLHSPGDKCLPHLAPTFLCAHCFVLAYEIYLEQTDLPKQKLRYVTLSNIYSDHHCK